MAKTPRMQCRVKSRVYAQKHQHTSAGYLTSLLKCLGSFQTLDSHMHTTHNIHVRLCKHNDRKCKWRWGSPLMYSAQLFFLTRIESIATIRWSLVYIYICLHSVVRQTTREWESPLCFSCWTCRCPTDKIPVTPRQLTERLFVCGKFSRTGLYQDWCHKSSRTHQQPLCKTREIIANCC